jgi:hypothetical protein
MIELRATNLDDPGFLEMVGQALNGAVQRDEPGEVYVVHINNWFHYKWLGFSGVLGLQLGIRCKPPLRVPPFNPSRVVSELHLRPRGWAANDYAVEPARHLHRRQQSAQNLKTGRLTYGTGSALLLWYSGGTASQDRGSLMVYSIDADGETSWYVSFLKKEDWQVNKLQGISRREFAELLGSDELAPPLHAQSPGIEVPSR